MAIQLNKKALGKGAGKFKQVDIGRFIEGRMFKETHFRAQIREWDWEQYRGELVLIKPCGSGPVPPWAFMLVLGKLVPEAAMVAYGEDCAPVVVFRNREKYGAKAEEVIEGEGAKPATETTATQIA